ncbi:MAG: restriction endonuclease subunit S [Leptospiraceae bacterium]|nr:restriction endonuclease subunit S [Leptospiraceae bacterium]
MFFNKLSCSLNSTIFNSIFYSLIIALRNKFCRKEKIKPLLHLNQGTSIRGITRKDLTSLQIPLPPTLAEQEKIAACLSSADELIQLETQKLELYKQHKRGLLQNLFPASTSIS